MGSKCMSCPEMAAQLAAGGTECFSRERNRSFMAAVTRGPRDSVAWKEAWKLRRHFSSQEMDPSSASECGREEGARDGTGPQDSGRGPREEYIKMMSKELEMPRRSPLPDLMEQMVEEEVRAFPSLPDRVLQSLSLSSNEEEELNAKDLEDKFSTLSIAFRTDKATLPQRVDLQHRQRDQAEKNVFEELAALRKALNAVYAHCGSNCQLHEQLTLVQQQLDVLHNTAARMVSRAELFGAVQQESRMSRAFEVLVGHVENLKRLHEREQAELRETRQILLQNKLLSPALSLLKSEDKLTPPLTRRRASLATIQRPSLTSQESIPQRPRLLSAAALIQSRFTPLYRRASSPSIPDTSPTSSSMGSRTDLASLDNGGLQSDSAPMEDGQDLQVPYFSDPVGLDDIYEKESPLEMKWREAVEHVRRVLRRPRELHSTLLAARYCAAGVLVAAGVLSLAASTLSSESSL